MIRMEIQEETSKIKKKMEKEGRLSIKWIPGNIREKGKENSEKREGGTRS